MKLNTITLEEWLQKQKAPKFFPNAGRVYPSMYKAMSDYLMNNVHTEVNMGALLHDGMLLTDHGPGHIATVIDRATKLAQVASCELTPYEVYLLLLAIHFHDVGNMYGRSGHEEQGRIILLKMGELACTDDVERRWVTKIAEAHGGEPKDKLEQLPKIEHILGHPVHVQFLAALLKLADEIADDFSRASKLPWELVPKPNQVFHKFAKTLKTVEVNHAEQTLKLHFSLGKDEAITKYGKTGNDDIYLVDEIYLRTYKTHLERLYCMRFLSPHIKLSSVAVTIDFHDENFQPIHEPIGYRLEERGYPSGPPSGLQGVCQEVLCSGESIKEAIERGNNA